MVALPWAVWHLPDFFVDEGLGIEPLLTAPVSWSSSSSPCSSPESYRVAVREDGSNILLVAIFHASFDASISELSFNIIHRTWRGLVSVALLSLRQQR